jgi:hypothetical protein
VGRSRRELEAAGHDVIGPGDWPQDPGAEEILAQATLELKINLEKGETTFLGYNNRDRTGRRIEITS